MAVASTPNIGLNLPSQGQENWSTLINQNFDKIDNEIKNNSNELSEVNNILGDVNSLNTTNKTSVANAINSHIVDYIQHPKYAITSGIVNTYNITLYPVPTEYVDGMGVVLKINATNTGASTLNVNGLGAKSIKDSLGNDIISNGLKANIIYLLRYDSVSDSFIIQGKEPDAKTVNGKQVNITPQTTEQNDIIGMINEVLSNVNNVSKCDTGMYIDASTVIPADGSYVKTIPLNVNAKKGSIFIRGAKTGVAGSQGVYAKFDKSMTNATSMHITGTGGYVYNLNIDTFLSATGSTTLSTNTSVVLAGCYIDTNNNLIIVFQNTSATDATLNIKLFWGVSA